MRRFFPFLPIGLLLVAVVLLITVSPGCSTMRPFSEQLSWELNAPSQNNPMQIAYHDHEQLWATIYDVMNGHFEVAKSDPVRKYDQILTEGRMTTKPKIAPSLMEPWHCDSGSLAQRCDSTLQTIRHRAEVRVRPTPDGFAIEMHVYKELENLAKPDLASVSTANLRYDAATNPLTSRIDALPGVGGWQLIGRDYQLEEKLLREIRDKLDRPPKVLRQAREPIRG